MTAELLRRLLDYDQATGVFTWKVRLSTVTPLGSVAGTIYKNGRRYITIMKKRYFASHLAWLMTTGDWPSKQIDHKNLNRSDDRFDNLRLATNVQNAQNKGVLKNNKLGIKGVQRRTSGRYRARIRVDGQLIHLGHFSTPDEASAAYAVAAKEHFGEFARSA